MQTVVETPVFTKQADDLFSEDEKRSVIDLLASNPLFGDEIPGTSGVRKVRVKAKGKGKRGGARVIYFYYDENNPVYALAVYSKNKKTDLSPDEKKAVSAFAKALKSALRSKS